MPAIAAPSIVRRAGRRRLPASRAAARAGAALLGGLLGVTVLFAVNWLYQVTRKPNELFAPLGAVLAKSPRATWDAYGPLFETHATAIVTPELLAALAQAEGQGNPLARTYWRWRLSSNPFEIYRPASSAVGMFQITDAAFAEARKYCVHGREVASAGAWYDPRACWFNGLYSRVVPSHAIEMTSARLHRSVEEVLARQRIARASLRQKQDLAAVIHLCGPRRGDAFARRGFGAAGDERCGAHGVRQYVSRVNGLTGQFARLRAGVS